MAEKVSEAWSQQGPAARVAGINIIFMDVAKTIMADKLAKRGRQCPLELAIQFLMVLKRRAARMRLSHGVVCGNIAEKWLTSLQQ